jgi:hypothetical protein
MIMEEIDPKLKFNTIPTGRKCENDNRKYLNSLKIQKNLSNSPSAALGKHWFLCICNTRKWYTEDLKWDCQRIAENNKDQRRNAKYDKECEKYSFDAYQ